MQWSACAIHPTYHPYLSFLSFLVIYRHCPCHTIDIPDICCVHLTLGVRLPHPSNSVGPPHVAEYVYYVAYLSNHLLVIFYRLRRWYLSLTYIALQLVRSLPATYPSYHCIPCEPISYAQAR